MIYLWNIKNKANKSDTEILREFCRKGYNNSRRLVKESYDLEVQGLNYFYDNRHLGAVESVLYCVAEYLYSKITYKPQKNELKKIMCDLKMGDLDYYKPILVENVINDCAFDYFKEDYDVLMENKCNPHFHCDFIIGKFKEYVTLLCRVIKENEVGFVFDRS